MPQTTINGYMRAVAQETPSNPLQTQVKLIITPFTPNANGVGIPRAEAENIIRTAQYQPLKINFDGDQYHGHAASIPIGPITSVYLDTFDGEEVIAGDAIIWNELYPDVVEHLKTSGSVHTSWEIFYTDAATSVDGVHWLNDCVFSGTVIVDNPAYRGKTPVLAIAEEMNEKITELEARLDALLAEQTREREDAAASLASVQAERDALTARVADLAAQVTAFEQAEQDRAQAARDASRRESLAPFGLKDDRVAFYLTLDDSAFDAIVSDLAALRGTRETSSDRAGIVPDPAETPAPRKLSGRELALELKNHLGS